MKLYYSPGACSLSVHILICETKLNVELEAVDLKTKQTASGEDFKNINPKGAVPTLITDKNEVLTENTAIQQYIAEMAHATELLPLEGDFSRYKVLEWLSYISSDVHKSSSPLFNPKMSDEMKQTIFIPQLKAKFMFVEKHLEGRKFLVNDAFTLPDAYLFVMLMWLPKFNIDVKEWPNLAVYFAKLKERESIKTALKEEGLG